MCRCLAELNNQLIHENTRIVPVSITHGDTRHAYPVILSEKIAKLRNGKSAVRVIACYCPFCGEKYDPPPNSVTSAFSTNRR